MGLAIMRLVWRLDAIDAWRTEIDSWKAVTDKALQELTMTDKIADAIAAKMNERRGIHLTRVQTTLAFCALLVPSLISVGLARILG